MLTSIPTAPAEQAKETAAEKKNLRLLSFPLLTAGLIFLFNPNINLFDPLPDAVGWFLLAAAVTGFSDVQPYFGAARRNFIRLGILNAVKIAALVLSLYIIAKYPDNRAMLSVFCLSFATLELIFALPTLRDLWRGFFYIGERDGVDAAIAGGKNLPAFTVAFLLVKHLGAFLPEFSLASVAYLDKGYSDSFLRAYPIFVAGAVILGLAVGGIWLREALKYLKPLKKDAAFLSYLERKRTENARTLSSAALCRRENGLLWILSGALLLAIDFIADRQNLLPDACSGLLFFLFFLFAARDRSAAAPDGRQCARLGMLFSALYTLVSAANSIFAYRYHARYDYPDVAYRQAAAALYRPVEITAVAEALLLFALLYCLYRLLGRFAATHTGLLSSDGRVLQNPETAKILSRQNTVFFLLGLCAALFHAAEVFFLTITEKHIISSAEANEYYSFGQVLYYPRFGGSWLIALALTLGWVIAGHLFLRMMKEEISLRYRDFADGAVREE